MKDDDEGNKDNVVNMFEANPADDPDVVLQEAIGEYDHILIVGWNKEGFLDPRSSTGQSLADMNLLLDLFKTY